MCLVSVVISMLKQVETCMFVTLLRICRNLFHEQLPVDEADQNNRPFGTVDRSGWP
jgi:hypothetical protein